ncbi:hypothetical protein COB11_07410 [Candidatus Aerophobetes bacterium]|uniref:HEXXH motif domain-containing protein n=1 Tax=Aerophobetes bacterium TaxID=2030807 RepID=A0A2A4YCI8_UNCAE|nr:MAG: hypothetical protein COB11_07410 [Candidatus Aerophobetes bacterium]
MFNLIGVKEVIGNLIKITKSYSEIPDKTSLTLAYRQFLREIQPKVLKPLGTQTEFFWKKGDIQALIEVFKEESILDDFKNVFDSGVKIDPAMPIFRLKEAFNRMRQICPSFANLVDIVIHTFFSAQSKLAGGGSTSAAIGCIWIDLRPKWSTQDVLEFIIHETTHNLVFIDEFCFRHYRSYEDVAKSENFAWSAILCKTRPLDKVFHSIVVSLEVLLFREKVLGHPERPILHPPTPILLEQTRKSILSINKNAQIESLLTNRSKFLLNKCLDQLETINPCATCGAEQTTIFI